MGAHEGEGSDTAGHLEHGRKPNQVPVYDVVPTPSNLHTWGLSENSGCTHCGRLANLGHVFSSWPSSLADGKYRWHHGKILAQWVDGVKKAMSILLHPLCESGRECSSRGKKQRSLGNSM